MKDCQTAVLDAKTINDILKFHLLTIIASAVWIMN